MGKNFFDFLDDLWGLERRPDDPDGGRARPIDPSEMRARSKMAESDMISLVFRARILAFEKQDKKCASCGTAITEEGANLRLIASKRGFIPENVILVCDACQKMLQSKPTDAPKEG